MMIGTPSLGIAFKDPGAGFRIGEAAVAMFVVSVAEVHLWIELAIVNESDGRQSSPQIELHSNRVVSIGAGRVRAFEWHRAREPVMQMMHADDCAPGRMSEVMYSESWLSFLEPLTAAGQPDDMMSDRVLPSWEMVRTGPIRVVDNLTEFVRRTNGFLERVAEPGREIGARHVGGNYFAVQLVGTDQTLFKVEENIEADGPSVVRRHYRGWTQRLREAGVLSREGSLTFVGNPQVRMRPDGMTCDVIAKVSRRRGWLDKGQAVRFWLRVIHSRAVEDEVVVVPRMGGEAFSLRYDLSFEHGVGGPVRTVIDVPRELTLTEGFLGGRRFERASGQGEFVPEWTGYSRSRGKLRHLGATPREKFQATVSGSQAAARRIRLAATFENRLREPRRLAKALIATTIIGILANPLLDWFQKWKAKATAFRECLQGLKGPTDPLCPVKVLESWRTESAANDLHFFLTVWTFALIVFLTVVAVLQYWRVDGRSVLRAVARSALFGAPFETTVLQGPAVASRSGPLRLLLRVLWIVLFGGWVYLILQI